MWPRSSERSRWKPEEEVLPNADGKDRTQRREGNVRDWNNSHHYKGCFIFHSDQVWKHKLFSASYSLTIHSKTTTVFAVGNDRAGNVIAMQLTCTTHLNGHQWHWWPQTILKTTLKTNYNVRGTLAFLTPHWQHVISIQNTWTADMASTS